MTAPGYARPPPPARQETTTNPSSRKQDTMITLKGSPTSFAIAGDRTHAFEIPLDREQLHPKVGKAFGVLEAARAAEAKVRKDNPGDRTATADANETVKEALDTLYDTAAGSAKATREHAAQQYDTAVRRYARALDHAQEALQTAATAAQVHRQAALSHGVGIATGQVGRAALTAHSVSELIETLPALPAIDEPTVDGRR